MSDSSPKIDEKGPLGLVLTLQGAPETPHTVVGVRGQYRTTRPTPIGEVGELTLAEAKLAIENGAPLELVNIAKSKVDELRTAAAEDLQLARQGAVTARQESPAGAEAAVLSDHIEAVKE